MSVNLIPQPKMIATTPGVEFTIDDTVAIVATGEALDAAWLLHDALRAATNSPTPVVDATDGRCIELRLHGERPAAETTAAESYRLDVLDDSVTITAGHPTGLVRAVQTFRQLMPARTLRAANVSTGPVSVPGVHIEDEPRFAWRGVMLDVARHFQPKTFVMRMIELAALHRLNVVHLHLTDDQGWRLDVPSWPKLTEIGSWRTETVTGHALDELGYDGTPHGGYYTSDDLREIVAFARARHITVVPEIDLPGHVRSVLAAYPHLGNTGDVTSVATTFGIFNEVLAPTDEALRFARDVFDTVVDIFGSPYIHIGGDECPRTQWRDSPAAQAKAQQLGLDDVDQIQSWFTKYFAEHLATHGRTIIGWDEILDGGAPPNAVISVWRDFAIAAKATAKGHRVIVAPSQAVYLDYYPSDDPREPLHIHHTTTFETVAGFEPVPDNVDASLIFGVQAQLWSEYLKTSADVEYAAFPRLAAVSDLAWSSMTARKESPLSERIPNHLERLDALGVNYRPLDGPKPWQQGGTGARRRFDTESVRHKQSPLDLPGK